MNNNPDNNNNPFTLSGIQDPDAEGQKARLTQIETRLTQIENHLGLTNQTFSQMGQPLHMSDFDMSQQYSASAITDGNTSGSFVVPNNSINGNGGPTGGKNKTKSKRKNKSKNQSKRKK